MADDTDFVALYDELGLDAECSMVDFKGATAAVSPSFILTIWEILPRFPVYNG